MSDAQREVLAEFEQLWAEHPEIRQVDALLVDLCGVTRGKRYPIEDAPKLWTQGLPIPYSVHFLDATGDCLDPLGRGISDGDPDGLCFPVSGSLALVGWSDTPRARVLMSMAEDDRQGRGEADPRNLAARVLARLQAAGLHPVTAFELEFYLLDPELGAHGRPRRALAPGSGRRESLMQVYGIEELDGFESFFRALDEECRRQGVPASVVTSEFAPGQYEVNLRHVAEPLVAADHAVLLRYVVRNVARREGLLASFMPKPYIDSAGNGMHIHMSVLDEQGRNIFDDGSARGGERLRQAIAGLLSLLPDSMAIFAPDANAFRRIGPGMYAPLSRSWAADNRSVAVRIPSGPGSARRFEHRVAAANANPYLVLAALLAGIHHGLGEQLDPGPEALGNSGADPDPEVPRKWSRALRRMAGSRVLADYFSADYVALYCAAKRAELEKFEHQITPREYQWYL